MIGICVVIFATHALTAVVIGIAFYWWGRMDGHDESFVAGLKAGRAAQLRESESASKALMRKTTGETLGYVVTVVEHLRDGGRIEFIEKEGD